MVEADEIIQQSEDLVSAPPPWRRWRIAGAGVLAILAALLIALWLGRERIADTWLAAKLDSMGLPATYDIARIGPDRQVLRNIVIGDPRHPDVTIEEVEIGIGYGLAGPAIDRVKVVRPRLYGGMKQGQLSFGSLDTLLTSGGGKTPGLPDIVLDLVDGRALIDADTGAVGIKAEGRGNLRSGFAGTLATIAPRVQVGGCMAERASLYGALRTAGGKPSFAGPARLASLDCADRTLRLAGAEARLDLTLDAALAGLSGRMALKAGAATVAAGGAATIEADAQFALRRGALTARYAIAAGAVSSPAILARRLSSEGTVRAHRGLTILDADGALRGEGLMPARAWNGTLRDAIAGARDTLAAPLLAKLRISLAREVPDSVLAGTFAVRRADGATSLVVPQASLRGGRGAALMAASRVQVAWADAATPRISGNFTTGGEGLPQIAGRMERPAGGSAVLRLTMADYAAGSAHLSVPRLTIAQARNGALGFAGRAVLGGVLPGGAARNLALPIDGNWSAKGGLALWRRCTAVAFDSLSLANLVLDRRAITLCPQTGGAVVRWGAGGMRIAAGVPSLDLSGRLGDTPLRLASGPVGFAWPGTVAARQLDVMLGEASAPTRFRIAKLTARTGSDVTGRFDGSQVLLAAVPLDMLETAGNWRYAGGVLEITGASFRLEDRQRDDRFVPLVARDARLRLASNVIVADAVLRAPQADRAVVRAVIRHDLATARGHADLRVDALTFDEALQPTDLTYLARGVVANTRGTIDGGGRIDWSADKVASTGRFSTAGLDLAAAFGPAKGIVGTVEFADLLGMVTAPDQRLTIASINPGIEATNGTLSFALQPGAILQVNGARWPFLDGTMALLPTRMVLGAAETRRFTLQMDGISAARFLERMELANLSASGVFDGTLPLVFDENGGHIEGGQLASRAPGGNVSYVGALTYKDLTPIANFAFDALKSLDYREMKIAMDGALEGEIVTRVRFAGVKQGAGTRQNFLTRRFANLPLVFNVNVRAPFFGLITSFKSFYDPTKLRDPRELGLLGADGKPASSARPAPLVPPAVQPPVIEKKP